MRIQSVCFIFDLTDELKWLEMFNEGELAADRHTHIQLVFAHVLTKQFPMLNPGIWINRTRPGDTSTFFDYESIRKTVRLDAMRNQTRFNQQMETLLRIHLRPLFEAPEDFTYIDSAQLIWHDEHSLGLYLPAQP